MSDEALYRRMAVCLITQQTARLGQPIDAQRQPFEPRARLSQQGLGILARQCQGALSESLAVGGEGKAPQGLDGQGLIPGLPWRQGLHGPQRRMRERAVVIGVGEITVSGMPIILARAGAGEHQIGHRPEHHCLIPGTGACEPPLCIPRDKQPFVVEETFGQDPRLAARLRHHHQGRQSVFRQVVELQMKLGAGDLDQRPGLCRRFQATVKPRRRPGQGFEAGKIRARTQMWHTAGIERAHHGQVRHGRAGNVSGTAQPVITLIGGDDQRLAQAGKHHRVGQIRQRGEIGRRRDTLVIITKLIRLQRTGQRGH